LAEIRKPKPVLLVIGMLSQDPECEAKARTVLLEKFGAIEVDLNPFSFEFTNYYQEEIGLNPVRSFLAFENLIEREFIPDIKLWTNQIELELFDGVRRVNLDPGYMTLGQFFLATTKDQRQRVYVRDGIFVEPTLYFQDGHFYPFEWTYRDYQSAKYIEYFELLRQRMAYQLKTGIPYSQR
jgi:hypothetical protein